MSHFLERRYKHHAFAILDINGDPVSWHSEQDIAARKVVKDKARFKRRHGYDGLHRSIVEIPEAGAWVEMVNARSSSWDVMKGRE